MAEGGEATIHHGVRCDGCDALPITGLRFKCQVCPDYDLCSQCKSSGKHAEHQMKLISLNVNDSEDDEEEDDSDNPVLGDYSEEARSHW